MEHPFHFENAARDNFRAEGRFLAEILHLSDVFSGCCFGAAVAICIGVLDPIMSRIEHYMDLLSARQKLVASNIANIDTPGYKTKDIDFQFEYISLTKGASPNVVEVPNLAIKNDGNDVSLDREARLLSENALRFNMASNLASAQLQLVRDAISETK